MGELRFIVAAVMACGSLVCLACVVRYVAQIESSLHRLHLQQSNIIAMLLKAGFRPAASLDWLDDGDRTRVKGETVHTQYDWKEP